MIQTKMFDGKAAAARIKEALRKESVEKNLRPNLAVVLVGENPSSLSYVKQKQKACQDLGWGFELHQLPDSSSFEKVKQKLLILNSPASGGSIDGIILQLPLPPSLRVPSYELTSYILPAKDIDGLTPPSPFTPPTALAVEYILESEEIKIEGAQVVVLGRGPTSGRPVAELLYKRGARIFVVHSQTDPLDAKRYTLNADLVVSCVGKPGLIKGEMIKEGAVVIGVGISEQIAIGKSQFAKDDKRLAKSEKPALAGDLDEKSLMGKVKLLTPTPGGIGPLTVAFLLKNLLRASEPNS